MLWIAILFYQHVLVKCYAMVMFERCISLYVALTALCVAEDSCEQFFPYYSFSCIRFYSMCRGMLWICTFPTLRVSGISPRRTMIFSSTRCDMSLFLQVIFVYCWVFYLKQLCMLSCIYPCLMHQLRRAQTIKLQANVCDCVHECMVHSKTN